MFSLRPLSLNPYDDFDGGSVSIASQAARLMNLAEARTPADRERLLLAIADLCDSAETVGALETGGVQLLLNDIFMRLVVEAERDIRRRLAEKLAHAYWAPRALVNVLALDEIEIAGPIIAASPILRDADLIRLLVESTLEHQIEVARRANLGRMVVDAILTQEEPEVLTALASNQTADISPDGMARLVEAARKMPSLRQPLSRHPRLTNDLAERLYIWVGQALRSALAARFPVDVEALERALAESVRESHAAASADSRPSAKIERPGEREEMERKLISKLDDAGQLKTGYLLRVLREGRLSLFEAGLAKLGGFTPEQVRAAVTSDTVELLALACSAVGVDRSVFPTILKLVRGLNDGLPSGASDVAQRAMGAFGPHPGAAAATAFKHAVDAAAV